MRLILRSLPRRLTGWPDADIARPATSSRTTVAHGCELPVSDQPVHHRWPHQGFHRSRSPIEQPLDQKPDPEKMTDRQDIGDHHRQNHKHFKKGLVKSFSILSPMKRQRGALAVPLALGVVLLPQIARADCTAAPEALRALCESPSLSQSWNSVVTRLATLKQSHPDLAPALEEDQALFLSLLEKTYGDVKAEHAPEKMAKVMRPGLTERISFLERLDLERGAGLDGNWENAAGAILVSPQVGGISLLQLSVAKPIMGLNTCPFDGTGKVQNGILSIELPPQGQDEFSLKRTIGAPLLGADLMRSGRPASGTRDCADSPQPLDGIFLSSGRRENPLSSCSGL